MKTKAQEYVDLYQIWKRSNQNKKIQDRLSTIFSEMSYDDKIKAIELLKDD